MVGQMDGRTDGRLVIASSNCQKLVLAGFSIIGPNKLTLTYMLMVGPFQ